MTLMCVLLCIGHEYLYTTGWSTKDI